MRFFIKILNGINDGLGKVEGFFLSVFLLTMIVLAFVQVIMRDVFNAGLPWADTVVRHLVLWVAFLGATLATRLDQHLTLEVVTKYLPDRGRQIAAVVVKIFAAVISFYLFSASVAFLKEEISAGGKFVHLFPAWWVLTIMPITFLLIPFHLIIGLPRSIQALVEKDPS